MTSLMTYSLQVEKTMQDCDLVDQADTFGAKLSGGQKRKLNVGMALIGDPKVEYYHQSSFVPSCFH